MCALRMITIRPAHLAMRPHESIGVFAGRHRSDRRDADHGTGG